MRAEARESKDSYWSYLREGGRERVDREEQKAGEAGGQSGLDFSTCFSFSSMVSLSQFLFSCHSQLYFRNHIRSENNDPKQDNTSLVVFYDTVTIFLTLLFC